MARTLNIENETHWKTSDIRRIVRAALDEAEADIKRSRLVKVRWQSRGSRVSYRVTGANVDSEETTVEVFLPRKGPKVLHHNALIALAAAGIDSSTPMLAVSDSYFIANALAYEFAKEAWQTDHADSNQKMRELEAERRGTSPPGWTDATKMIITKYADPTKDGSYVDFKAKKEKEIESADARIHKWEAELSRVQRNLNRAKKDKKKAQDALVAARKRRAR